MKNIITIKDLDNNTLLSIDEKSYTIVYDNTKESIIYNSFFNSCDTNILFRDKEINIHSLNSKKNNIEILNNKYNKLLTSNTVYENLMIRIESLNLNKDNVLKRFNKFLKVYNYEMFINTRISDLSYGQKYLILFLILICQKPSVLVIDDLLDYLDKKNKEITISLLNKINENGTTIIYFTNNINNIFIGNDYLILKENKIIINSSKKNIDVKKFTDNNISLPFIVDLTKKLRYYIPIKQSCYNINELVDEIWMR